MAAPLAVVPLSERSLSLQRDAIAIVVQHDPVYFESKAELAFIFYFPASLQVGIRGLVEVLLPMHMLQSGHSVGSVGAVASAAGFASMAVSMPAGKMLSKIGPKAVVMCSLLCSGVGSIILYLQLYVLSDSSAALAAGLGYAIINGSYSMGDLARVSYLSASMEKGIRSSAINLLSGLLRIGLAVAPAFAGVVADRKGMVYIYVILLTLCVVSVTITYFFLPHVYIHQKVKDGESKLGDRSRAANAHNAAFPMLAVIQNFWRPLCSACFFCFCFSAQRRGRTFLFSLVGHEEEMSQEQLGIVASASYAVSAVCFPLGSLALDKLGDIHTGTLASGLFALSSLAVQFPAPAGFWAFAAISGLADSVGAGFMSTLGSHMAPSECRGEFLGVFKAMQKSAHFICPAILASLANLSQLRLAEFVLFFIGMVGTCWIAFGMNSVMSPQAVDVKYEKYDIATVASPQRSPKRLKPVCDDQPRSPGPETSLIADQSESEDLDEELGQKSTI